MKYAELQITSNFSFMLGGSHPEDLTEKAMELGYTHIAITDRNTVAGVVRAYMKTKKTEHCNLKFIPACRLDLLDGPSLLAYPTDVQAWSRLCALLSLGNLRTEKGKCDLYRQDVFDYAAGIIFILVSPPALNENFDFNDDFKHAAAVYKKHLKEQLYVAATRSYSGNDAKRFFRLQELGIPMVATGDIYYHDSAQRELQDIETCVKEKCTVYDAGFKLQANAERYLKPITEIERLFRNYPEALVHTQKIADSCNFSLDELKYLEPEWNSPDGRTADEHLAEHTWKGARRFFGEPIPLKQVKQINFELDFFKKRQLAPYFLRIFEYTQKADELGILRQGRGSAANCTVCFCLGITPVDPRKQNLLFSRFMSDQREEWPDVDVDFEHERREEIIQWIYETYGREYAGIVATVTQQRHKGALRDVGKAMGLSEDVIKRLGSSIWSFKEDGFDEERLLSQGLDPKDPLIQKVLELTQKMMGFPRQLGQHTGGFVIMRCKLSDICPVMNARMENRTQLEWNKDDLEDLGILKVDVLALGMLTCIRKAFDMIRLHYKEDYNLQNVPQNRRKVYDMICRADTLGVFQIESRAQMSMLPRLKPRKFYDLVIEVAIVRPGPIQGDMVHPYLRRRDGLEKPDYPKPELKKVLKRTKGVPLFQEQAMEIAIVAAGFSPGESDQLRKSMATFKAKGEVAQFKEKFIKGMLAKEYEPEFAERVFKQIEGFGGYGFPESHAASFAHLVYVSCWIKYYYPDVFCAALLNSQPMGFYQPAEIVDDAIRHNVTVLPVDVNYSQWDSTLTTKRVGRYFAVRLGFRQVKGLKLEEMEKLVASRGDGYKNLIELSNAAISRSAIERLIDADAFRSMGVDRREALWELPTVDDKPIGLFKEQVVQPIAQQLTLPLMSASEHVVHDINFTGLSLKANPVSFVRNELDQLKISTTAKLKELSNGAWVKVAGIITVRQRPGTAKGILFITIKDETGYANLVIWAKVFEKFKREILQSKLFMVEGRVQIEGRVIHVLAKQCFNLNRLLLSLTPHQVQAVDAIIAQGDAKSNLPISKKEMRESAVESVFYKGRNFR